VPVRFRVVYDNVEIINSGFRGSTNYNGALINLGYGPVVGPGSGILSFIKGDSLVTTAYVYIDSPIDNVEYSFNVSCPL
ncbi:MAG: hypothetical protein ACO3UU_17455, partial [Minisyncoccia bacterium]